MFCPMIGPKVGYFIHDRRELALDRAKNTDILNSRPLKFNATANVVEVTIFEAT